MFTQTDNLVNLLTPFDISEEESFLYLHLLKNGTKSALDLSREIKMGRTKVYRILDKLIKKQLVTQKYEGLGFKFSASSYHQLELLFAQKEHNLEALKDSMPAIFAQLDQVAFKENEKSKVLYYQGIEGLKQVTWNSLQAEGELLIFEIADMSSFLDHGFAEEVRKEFVKRKIKIKELTNLKKMPAWTDVQELMNFWQVRFVDPKLLKMKFEILLYNNCLTMYSYKEGEIFCVEIYNQDLVDMQKQLFNFIWSAASEMKILNNKGEAII